MRALTASVVAECASSDHWPPELLAPSLKLPAGFARQLAADDDLGLPALPPMVEPSSATACYATPKHFCVHLLSERGRLRYSIDDGGGAVTGRTLVLRRHETYTFQMAAVHTAHPLVLSLSESGPDRRLPAWEAIVGAHPASRYDVFAFTPRHGTPSTLYYQSVSRAGVGGPIAIENAPAEEPRSLLGYDGVQSPTPSAMLLWDAYGATLHHWVPSDAPAGEAGSGGVLPSAAAASLEVVGHLPLASIAYAALYNTSYAAWRAAFDARMAHAPIAPNMTYINVTNSTNQSVVWLYDGVEVNATNMTAAWLAFEATLPRMEPVPQQTVASATLRHESPAVYWSTNGGHLFTAALRFHRAGGVTGGAGRRLEEASRPSRSTSRG